MVKTGGARCHSAGTNRPEFCKHCLCKFPKQPNGQTHGYKHYELLLAGPDSRPRQGPAYGKGKGKGKGSGKSWMAFNSQSYNSTPWRKDSENRKSDNFRKSILGDMEKLSRGKGVGDTVLGPTPAEAAGDGARRPGLSDRWAHGLVACMPIPAELTEPQGLASAFLPAKLRAPLVEPLVLRAACPDPRFDLQVVIPYFCEAANYRAIPSIQRVERFMRRLGLPP